ncbi:MAG: radical SAM protein, partial [Gammaproteobacteria bacterium]|nr:radical SAM protein [Gammaproteobacteria bacterium]
MNASTASFTPPRDRRGRPLHDLRISVTDRCNFRCTYCMPKEVFNSDYVFLERSRLLTFEEIERLVRVFVDLGVVKLRLTGGEPLLRRHLDNLVERLAQIPEIEDICLTTNGSLLTGETAARLAEAGLDRIT